MVADTKLKKSLTETKDIIGQTVKLGDRVAYSRTGYNGYNVETHVGTVKRITEKSVWVLPDEPFKNDRCGRKIEVGNGEPKFLMDPNAKYRWQYHLNPKWKHIRWDESPVHDWYCRRADSVIRI